MLFGSPSVGSFWRAALRGRLARRLILATVSFSAAIALVITVAQLLIEYQRDVRVVDERFGMVEQSYLPSIIDSVWVADNERTRTLLGGIVRLPDFAVAEIRHEGKEIVRVGKRPGTTGLTRTWPLHFEYRGEKRLIGELEIGADLASARARVIERVWFVVSTNFVKTLLVALFLFVLVHAWVTRHLERISEYAADLSPARLDLPLDLKRGAKATGDEIDRLVRALNMTRENLRRSYGEMRELNHSLEERVAERTAELSQEVKIRRQNEAALQESEGQLRAVFDAALTGIVVIDEIGRIRVFNPAARDLFGYDADELIGQNVKVLMPEEHASRHDGYLQRYREGGKPGIIGRARDLTGRRKDGSGFPMRLSVSESCAGGRRLFIGAVQDLTERHEFENALVDSRIVAEQASAAKSDFLARMSHELRTPLNSIIGFSQLLLGDRKEPLTEWQRENVLSVLQGGRHLLELVNEVLQLARSEVGRLDIKMERINLVELAESCLHSMKPLALPMKITVHPLAATTAPVWVTADATRLRQSLLNLLSNALKYNHAEGEVFVEIREDGDWVRLDVRDTGIGFDPEQARKLFLPFSRLHPKSGIEGNGIGLALTLRMVELMGGSIRAVSRPGAGSTFSVLLKPPTVAAK